jgi:peptidoglycan/xylan/chitin deacetylase (PgdA/CDA1 family)
MVIGRRESLEPVLQALNSDSDPGLNPGAIAGNLFTAVPLGAGRVADAWDDLWPEVAGDLSAFLATLEQQSGSWQLARRSLLVLERLTLDLSRAPRPFTRGRTHAVAVDITQPIDGIRVSDPVERVHCAVMADGERIGAVVLPVFDGVVSARVLADTIAARFAWPILRRFFGATLYRELAFRRAPDGLLICRDGVPLAPAIRDDAAVVPEPLHDHVGWTLFLQELWGLSPKAEAEVYQEGRSGEQSPLREAGWKVVEVSDELPMFETPDSAVTVEPRVGGVALGLISVPSEGGRVTSSRLRSVITTETGFELCRVAVREGILGRPFEGGRLRKRLAEAAKACGPAAPSYAEVIPPEAADLLTLDWPRVVGRVAGSERTLCLSRYRTSHPEAPADRRADLPRAVMPELLAAAALASPPVVRSSNEGAPQRVAYLPELVSRPAPERDQHVAASAGSPEANQSRPHDRHHFESLFALGEDAVHLRRSGGRPAASDTAAPGPPSLPILMYHSISTDGPAATARYRVRPDAFEAQLRYLRDAGFTTVALSQWFAAVRRRRPLPARPVVITFDDGYRDFEANAWPLLQRYGFGALVFLVADLIGDSARWDARFGKPLPLMGWDEIRRLASQGVEFGAHSSSHRPLTGLTPTEIAREAVRSRVVIERGLGHGVETFAYPYGDTDPIVEHVVGASGFQLGLTCRPGPAEPRDSALALPRIEVSGDDDLASFIGKLG